MARFDEIIGRSPSSKTSPKSVVREIGATKGQRLTPKQCKQLLYAIAYTMELEDAGK